MLEIFEMYEELVVDLREEGELPKGYRFTESDEGGYSGWSLPGYYGQVVFAKVEKVEE